MFRRAALVFSLSLPLLAAAEEPSSPPVIAKAPDFSEAFRKLESLGLPPIKDAEWTSGNPNSVSEEDYQLREMIGQLQGHGWKFKVDGQERFLGFGNLDTTDVPKGEGGGSRGLLGSLFGGGSSKPKGADLRKDADHLTAILNDPAKSGDFREGIEYSGKSSVGRLLIFAAQLHQTGHPEEANRLAAAVFSLGLPPEQVIDSAVNRLATREYSLVVASFVTTRDWSAYHQGLQKLVTRYPRGWDDFGAIQILLPAVANRVADTPPPKPVLEGVVLNPEAVAALDEIFLGKKGATDEAAIQQFITARRIPPASVTPQMREQIIAYLESNQENRSSGAWLIQDPQAFQGNSPEARLKRLGVEALPVLAAFAKDGTLVTRMNSGSSRSSYSSRSDSAEEKLLKSYQKLRRPLSRGEIACELLAATLPSGEDTNQPEVLAESAIGFWKANRGKTQLELIKEFITSESYSQKSQSLALLSGMPEDAARQLFEQFAAQEGNAMSSGEAVRNYLKIHKGSAKAFFAAYSTALKAEMEGQDPEMSSGGYQIRQAGGVDAYLKKLSLLVGGESPQKMLFEIAKAEKPDLRQIRGILETLDQRPKEEIITMILEATIIARSPETRIAFLSALDRQEFPVRTRTENDEATASTEQPIPSSLIEKWTTLLTDNRITKSREIVSFVTAVVLEGLYSSSDMENLRMIGFLDHHAYRQIVLDRAQERVSGKALTPIPDGSKVTSEQVLKLLESLAPEKPEVVSSRMQAWTMQEKLGYMIWKGKEENGGKVPASVIAAQRVVLPVADNGVPDLQVISNEILETLGLGPGTELRGDILISVAEKFATQIKASSGLAIEFTPSSLGNGRSPQAIRVFDLTPEQRKAVDSDVLNPAVAALEETSGVVILTSGSTNGFSSPPIAVWALTGSAVEAPAPETLVKWRTEITKPLDPYEPRGTITLSVLHRDDLEKLKSIWPSSSLESDPFAAEQE